MFRKTQKRLSYLSHISSARLLPQESLATPIHRTKHRELHFQHPPPAAALKQKLLGKHALEIPDY